MKNASWPQAREYKATALIPLLSQEDLKRQFRIRQEDTRQDKSLQRFAVKWQLAQEYWLGRTALLRDRIVYRVEPDPETYGLLPNVLLLIQEALAWLIQYEQSLEEPAAQDKEDLNVVELSRRANEIWQKDPGKWVIQTRFLSLLREKEAGLWCGPTVNWTLTRNEPQLLSTRKGAPLVTVRQGESRKRELLLSFLRADCSPPRRVDVLVDWGGEPNRIRLPRKTRQWLIPAAQRRLYLPLEQRKNQQWNDRTLLDACAMICVYLIQGKLVSLDDNLTVSKFLSSYLSTFKKVEQLGASEVLENLLRHYQFPEHPHGWRRYLNKTIAGLDKKEKGQDRSYVIPDVAERAAHQMIPAVASFLGIPERTLYHLAKQGRVRTEEISVGNERYLTIPDSEIERLKREHEEKSLRKALIAAWAKKQGITIASARRWVERQEAQGLGLKEMINKIGLRKISP
ncbi:MAG TPA: hypothetical protein VKK81_09715 [Candidatus Binatia bacterium]|nr:hypothetical protein [Candidatus Binatia bacterium]